MSRSRSLSRSPLPLLSSLCYQVTAYQIAIPTPATTFPVNAQSATSGIPTMLEAASSEEDTSASSQEQGNFFDRPTVEISTREPQSSSSSHIEETHGHSYQTMLTATHEVPESLSSKAMTPGP